MAPFIKEVVYSDEEAGYWDTQLLAFGTTEQAQAPSTLGASRCTLKLSRTAPTGFGEDHATLGFCFAKATVGPEYGVLSTAEKTAAEGWIDTWWGTVKAQVHTSHKLVELIWHDRKANDPALEGGGGFSHGAAVRRQTRNVAGTGASEPLPFQVACAVTLRTASRKHWGRAYIPGLVRATLETDFARITPGVQTSFAGATRTMLIASDTAATPLVVWSETHRAVLSVSEIVVDDIPDIQRRRRGKRSASRVSHVS